MFSSAAPSPDWLLNNLQLYPASAFSVMQVQNSGSFSRSVANPPPPKKKSPDKISRSHQNLLKRLQTWVTWKRSFLWKEISPFDSVHLLWSCLSAPKVNVFCAGANIASLIVPSRRSPSTRSSPRPPQSAGAAVPWKAASAGCRCSNALCLIGAKCFQNLPLGFGLVVFLPTRRPRERYSSGICSCQQLWDFD